MTQTTAITRKYVTVAEAAYLLGLTVAEVLELVDSNEIESRTLILRDSLFLPNVAGDPR